MCGLAGIIQLNGCGDSDLKSYQEKLSQGISHRGPDEQDFFLDEQVLLCHSR